MDTETRCLFRALFRKQLREQGAFLVRSASTGRHRTRAGRLAFGALYGGIVLLVMGSFFSLAWPLGELLLPAGQEALYFLTMELLALAVGVFAGAFSSYGSLFQARDNDLLLAMPIPPWMIFAVRMSGLYAMCLFYLLLLWVPAEVMYGLYAASPLGGLLSAAPMALLLAGAATLLAALLGWVVALCTARAAHKTLVTVAATLGLAVVYDLAYQRGMAQLEPMLGQAALGENNTALTGAGRFLGGAACGEPLLLLVLAVGIVLLCAALGRALSGPYLTLMTTRRGAVKRTRARLTRRSSLRRTLLRRELLHLGSSASYLLNCAMGSLALLLLSGAMGYKAEALRALAARLPARELGAVLLTFTVVLVAGMNLLTVPSVSLEGEQLWQLQSLPVTPWQVLRAKLDLHLLVTLPPALLCLACGLVLLRVPWTSALLAGLLVALDVVFTAAAGLMFGVTMPRFHWTSEMAVIKQNPSVLLALLVNWAAGFVLGVGVLVLAQFVPAEAAWMAALGILALADGAALRWLKTKGAERLRRL